MKKDIENANPILHQAARTCTSLLLIIALIFCQALCVFPAYAAADEQETYSVSSDNPVADLPENGKTPETPENSDDPDEEYSTEPADFFPAFPENEVSEYPPPEDIPAEEDLSGFMPEGDIVTDDSSDSEIPDSLPAPDLFSPSSMSLLDDAQDTVISVVYEKAGINVKFTQLMLDSLTQTGPVTFSNYNTFPNYGTNDNICGVTVTDLLTAAGINVLALDKKQTISFSAGGYNAVMTIEQLLEDRFFFTADGTKGERVPVMIGFDQSDSTFPRNFFGQAYAGEQTRNLFVQRMTLISIGDAAGQWDIVSATPSSGSNVSAGSLIRLKSVSEAAGAKIHYTLDGTDPTRESAIYNLIAESWLVNHGMTENTPIKVPDGSGKLILKAFVSGLGKIDSDVLTFEYIYTSAKLNQDPPTGLSGGLRTISGTTSAMEYNMNAAAQSGWKSCVYGETPVAAGIYFVRYKQTETHNASAAVQINVSDKLSQPNPQDLSAGNGMIVGTTTAMQYHTDPDAAAGWLTCFAGSTSVADGIYYVRYTETATHNASGSVRIIIGKLPQSAPTGLGSGTMSITGTTPAMEYTTNPSVNTGWIVCLEGITPVSGSGVYYIRFSATPTHNASPYVTLVISEDKRETILTVYIGGQTAKMFTQKDLDLLTAQGPYTYSSYNTWPTYETLSGITGVRVMDLLAAAGISGLSSGQGIRFTSSDGYSGIVTVGQLEQPRYFFSAAGSRGGALPSIINLTAGDDYRRLVFGQATSGEQIHPSYVKDVIRIDVEGNAGYWSAPTATPSPGSTLKQGDLIRLSIPPGQGDAKIYYTLDGSEPTLGCAMYNYVADRWLFQKGMSENTPISAPGGAFTIKAKIIGIGRNDGPVATFSFNASFEEPEPPEIDEIANATIEDLLEGSIGIGSGESFFVPAKEGSIIWNPDEMDGYYDAMLGGYIFTPKSDFTGVISFKYIDDNGAEHDLSVTVESKDIPIAGNNISTATGILNEARTTDDMAFNEVAVKNSGMPVWSIVTLFVVPAAAAGVLIGYLLPRYAKNKKRNVR